MIEKIIYDTLKHLPCQVLNDTAIAGVPSLPFADFSDSVTLTDYVKGPDGLQWLSDDHELRVDIVAKERLRAISLRNQARRLLECKVLTDGEEVAGNIRVSSMTCDYDEPMQAFVASVTLTYESQPAIEDAEID